MKAIILISLISVAFVDYSKFSHTTKKHQAECKTCHAVPTRTWQKTSTFPDIVDYPDHAACVSCHRAQFFKGARPQICSVCHSKTSPRDDVRFAFRNPAARLQFTIEFPHDKHQDVIARVFAQRERQNLAHAQQQNYNNCTICHASQTTTFKAAPTDHASCFNCHWKSQQPVAANCNGCHKLSAAPYDATTAPNRISAKFVHEGGGEKQNHVLECTSCHINITKSASLRGLKPDVPITACTECHNKDAGRQDLNKELVELEKNRAFACTYCHAANVGSLDAPLSHFLIAQRKPVKRK